MPPSPPSHGKEMHCFPPIPIRRLPLVGRCMSAPPLVYTPMAFTIVPKLVCKVPTSKKEVKKVRLMLRLVKWPSSLHYRASIGPVAAMHKPYRYNRCRRQTDRRARHPKQTSEPGFVPSTFKGSALIDHAPPYRLSCTASNFSQKTNLGARH